MPRYFFLLLTAKSFIDLVRYLFQVPGVQSFLSRRICQDFLEKFFGCQRQIGRTHDNPTVKEFEQNTQSLRVVDSFARSSLKDTNCRGNPDLATDKSTDLLEEKYYLPKRKRIDSKKWKPKTQKLLNLVIKSITMIICTPNAAAI